MTCPGATLESALLLSVTEVECAAMILNPIRWLSLGPLMRREQ